MKGGTFDSFRGRITLITLLLINFSSSSMAPAPNVATAAPVPAQGTPKRVFLGNKSNIPLVGLAKAIQKKCPNVSVTDKAESDYTLEALKVKGTTSKDVFSTNRDVGLVLTLFDRDGAIVHTTFKPDLIDAVKDLCQAIKRVVVLVEVVDTQNLTQSADIRGVPNTGVLNELGITGRNTHTDASTMHVIVNSEHALLDCYEHRKGCITVGPGKYYGEFDQDRSSIWINFEIPLTHKPVRDHYVIAGAW